MNPTRQLQLRCVLTTAALALCMFVARETSAQVTAPTLVDPHLDVRTVASGLVTPVSLAFIGRNNLLVLEKNTGRVQHVVNGTTVGTAIDLAVNNNSERGLLGIALHPNFPAMPFVYLYWTCRTAAPPTDLFLPDAEHCDDSLMLAATAASSARCRSAAIASIASPGTARP